MTTAIWWIRRDLRLRDNQALSAAIHAADNVLPVYIFDPALVNRSGERRLNFLQSALQHLNEKIRARGGEILFRRGDPLAVLVELTGRLGGAEIFAERDVTPFARRRDDRVAGMLPLTLTPGVTAIPAGMVTKNNGEPYRVYTPFSKAWKNLPLPAADFEQPSICWASTVGLRVDSFPRVENSDPEANSDQALAKLRSFTSGDIYRYQTERNRVDLNSTSKLSAAFHFGLISAAQAVTLARAAMLRTTLKEEQQSAGVWLNEVIWREFYAHILFHFPFVRHSAFRPQYRNLPWRDSVQDLRAWQTGQTGFPIVDAAMRQMLETGWMHNRSRMIVASFLVKDLLIDWKEGERFFLKHLVDGDIANNNGGWQWTAGVGTDAAPYFRIFNPTSQSIKFDPHGEYIRRWVPELRSVPDQWIHEPAKMDSQTAKSISFKLGETYPAPIVEHSAARKRALEFYKRV